MSRAGLDAEVAIAGGGLAGAALAIQLARQGRQVVVLERDQLPRDKLCGEFLSAESRRLLDALGALGRVEAAGAVRLERARFTAPSGHEITFPLPHPALGISRRVLDALLLEVAAEAGAAVRTRVEVQAFRRREQSFEVQLVGQESLRAGWAIGAHGRRARLDQQLERGSFRARSPFVGLKRHHRPRTERVAAELLGAVEIHGFDGGYLGLSFVEGGVVNACLLAGESVLEAAGGGGWETVTEHVARQNPHLAARLEALEPLPERALAVAQVSFEFKEREKDEVLFVGDAAGMIAPLAGDGQAMALASAHTLGALLLKAPASPTSEDRAALARRWDRAWRLEFELRMRLARLLQGQLLAPRRADRLVRGVAAVPGLAGALVRLTRGAA